MKDGVASHTARSVAARRLTCDRVPADYGDPGVDLALSRDVAAGLEPAPGRMHDYIRAWTAFFDRVVVTFVAADFTKDPVAAALRHPRGDQGTVCLTSAASRRRCSMDAR